MKVVKKNVYYCDFCKKRGLSGGHMKAHEEHCTMNPGRYCRMCDMLGNKQHDIRAIVEGLRKCFEIKPVDVTKPDFALSEYENTNEVVWKADTVITLTAIRQLADNCPVCILAILRQTNLNWDCCGLEKFDFQKEIADALDGKTRGIKKSIFSLELQREILSFFNNV